MSTLKLENIKHENSVTNNMVMDSDGSVSVTNKLGVGTTDPEQKVHIKHGVLTIDGGSTEAGPYLYRDNGNAPDIRFFTHNNTKDNPSAKTSGQNAGQIHWQGHDGTDYQIRASLEVYIDDTVSTGNVPMRMEFKTGNSGTRSTALKIDNHGYVTKPRQPSFKVYDGSGTTWTNTTVKPNLVVYDNVSGYSTSTGRYTVPTAGVYMFRCDWRTSGTSGGGLDILASDGQRVRHEEPNGSHNPYHQSIVALFKLNANDYVELSAFGSTGVRWDQNPVDSWSGILIG